MSSLNFPIENLFEWLRTFNIATNVYSIHNVTDGIVLAKVLYTIAPNHFTDDWLQKLNHDAEINWRLKVSNLKKILKAVVEFLNERIEDRISVQFLPNLQEIAEHENEEDTFRLLQLILACAVNCDNKQTYIQTIMGMEETVQQALMEAIQQLMSTRLNIHDTMDYEDRLCKTIEQYKTLLMEKDKLTEQCKTLQQEVFSLQEEKSNHQSELNRFRIYFESLGLNPALLASTTTTASATLSSSSSTLTTSTATTLTSSSSPTSTMPPHTTNTESIETGSNHSNNNNNNNPTVNINLLNQISDSIASNANVLMSPTVANVRINHLQNQLTKLRDELYRTECDKEELKIQLAEITAQNQELKQKCTILTAKAEETLHLKDELDIAREEALNVVHLSKTIEQLRKHADEVVSLRLRCTQLETDNEICLKRLTELEQETRLNGNIRTQIKTQARLQVENAQYLTNESIRRAELAEQNLLKIRQELINVTREKECIFAELTRLKSCCEGLQSCVETSNYGTPAMQSQMSNLQEELSRLRTSVYSNEIIMGSGHSINEIGFDVTITPTTTTTTTPNADSTTTNSSILGGDDHNMDKNYYYSRRTHSTTNSVTSQNKLMNTHDNTSENNNCSSTTTQSLPLSSANSSQHHLPIDDRNHSNHDANTLLYTDLLTKLTQKETDYIEMEQKYRGYLWKAREVIRLLERQYRQHQHDCAMYKEERKIMMNTDSNNTNNNDNSSSNDKIHQEIAHLRELLVEKERVIEKLETHHEQVRRHREAEERILLTAWYNLVIKSTRTSIESDLKQSSNAYPETLNSDTTTNNNNSNNVLYNTENNLSFLARQRNIHLKPSIDLTSLVTARK